MSSASKSDIVQFERWVRITCPNKNGKEKCKAGTFIPAKGLPQFVVCCICRKRIPTAGMVEQPRR